MGLKRQKKKRWGRLNYLGWLWSRNFFSRGKRENQTTIHCIKSRSPNRKDHLPIQSLEGPEMRIKVGSGEFLGLEPCQGKIKPTIVWGQGKFKL